VLLDELGNINNAVATEYYSVLTTGFGAQIEPLTLLFSTQAPSDQHLFSTQVDRAKKINEGMLPFTSFAGFVFTTPERDENGADIDPHDERWWHLSNPGLDTIVSRKVLRDFSQKAKELPSLENKFRLLHLNQRVSETASLVSRTVWAKNTHRAYTLEELAGKQCALGADLSQTTDFTALVAVFEEVDGVHPVVPFFWVPGNDLQGRAYRDNVPLDVWAKDGYIDASSDHVVDYALVADKILEIIDTCKVQCLGFDRYRMKHLKKALKDKGMEIPDNDEEAEDRFFFEIGQGFVSQTRTVDLLEEGLLTGVLAHGGNPVLTWHAGNTVVVKDPAGNRKFDKAKSFGRIDGMVAMGLAIHAWDEKGLEDDSESVYGTDDFFM
jgi:phage terminase large subunit-like protein